MAQIQEPQSAYNAQYPHNNVVETESGHFQEFDDTPGAERMRWQHKAGTFTEWRPDGTEVHHIIGNGYHISDKDGNIIIDGQCNISIGGNAEITINGDAVTTVKGSVKQVVEQDYSLLVKGTYTVNSSGNLNLKTTGGYARVSSKDSLVVDADLYVHGEVLADSVHSNGSVTAGTGIHAGLVGSANHLAGISTLGGVNVGIAGPTVPGTVTATVLVTAPAVIGRTIVYGGILMDPEGGAPLIRSIYDSHIHTVLSKDFGVTGVPFPLMP